MINFKNINFSYDKNEILKNFNCSFNNKKINCIIAPSGAGKTTLLNIIAKISRIKSGKISNLSNNVSYLFQDDRLINEITIFQNLDLILRSSIKDKEKRRNMIEKGLKSVDLYNTINMFPAQLSGGMKRMLTLLRAFLYKSDILLMDEPFAGLDINIKNQVIKLFLKLWNKDKRTVFLICHNIDEILLVADEIFIMDKNPLTVIKTIKIEEKKNNRKLWSKSIISIKKNILNTISNWKTRA